MEHCFSRVRLKGFFVDGQARFSHRHSRPVCDLPVLPREQRVSRKARPSHRRQGLRPEQGAARAAMLSTKWNCPTCSRSSIPSAPCSGRANYSDYFICYHNCTVGANLDNDYPVVRPRHRDVWRQPRDRTNSRSATTLSCRRARSSSTAATLEADSILHGIYPNARRSPQPATLCAIFSASEARLRSAA